MKNENFNPKVWLCIISIALSLAIIAVACLGAALVATNNQNEELIEGIRNTNSKVKALSQNNEELSSELDALKDKSNNETATDATLEKLTNEITALKDALLQSNAAQKNLENTIESYRNVNQAAVNEINQLKSDLEKANEEIDELNKQNESEQKIKIYIDQGHNPTSHNTGASANGLYEEDITFTVGAMLADILRADCRFEVKLSRPNKSVVLGTDNDSSLKARVDGAKEFDADYFISLHVNSYTGEGTATGVEIYSKEERGESYIFGETLLESLTEATALRNRNMKVSQSLYVLNNATMPAVLVEMGFITNTTDATLLSEQPDLFAKGLYNGILEYFGLFSNNSVNL